MQKYVKVTRRQLYWLTLIKLGRAYSKWVYYAADFEYDSDKSEAIKKLTVSQLIDAVDWTKTPEPKSSSKFGFAGTFADDDDNIATIEGQLFLKRGGKVEWAATVEFSKFMNAVFDILAEEDLMMVK